MQSLRESMDNPEAFLCGVELVSTRGTMVGDKANQTRAFASDLTHCDRADWVSITDNAGGNPALSPAALGRPIIYAGKEVLIHLSCKDFNRNGLQSTAWHLASDGFHNILALTGDYPSEWFRGGPKTAFDIDSVGLLTLLSKLNRDMETSNLKNNKREMADVTNFYLGAVVTNFKLLENEVVPQYLKLEKKLNAGARFIITQIGYDSRKFHELKAYLEQKDRGQTPLIGNVYLLNLGTARFFRTGKIPGVVVSEGLLVECERQAASADKGKAFFMELATRQVAIFRGLGYRGVYLGGIQSADELTQIMDQESSLGANDWKDFAQEISFSRSGEFFYFSQNPATGLADPSKPVLGTADSPAKSSQSPKKMLSFRINRWIHRATFTPGSSLFRFGQKIYSSSKKPSQGPRLIRSLERAGKSLLFDCKDCGDCSLPETTFLCPESLCAKNQRNGPCGGTRDGLCEVEERECIWSLAYDRLRSEGRHESLLDFDPVIQNHRLRETSSWANTFLNRDHRSRIDEKKKSPSP